MEVKRILIVEDEVKIASMLEDFLSAEGYKCKCLYEGTNVVSFVQQYKPDFILLDLMLPGVDGLTLCKEIRQNSTIPIMIITAKGDELDRLMGLGYGADDYICKPFSIREVAARIKTILKRVAPDTPQSSDILAFGQIKLDKTSFECYANEQVVALTPVEFRMLSYLVSHPKKVTSRDELMNSAYQDNRIVSYRTIDSHMKNIRAKLGQHIDNIDQHILSVYGVGYRLKE